MERSNFSPDNIQTITINYSIGRIGTVGDKIKESIKINLKECTFRNEEIILSFSLEQLHEPHKCEITLHSLTISFRDGTKSTFKINITRRFKDIESDFLEVSNYQTKDDIAKSVKAKNVEQGKIREIRQAKPPKNDDFTDSYEQFKLRLHETDLIGLIKRKASTIDFSLKDFGISLLCKLLLLVKYMNQLVDNDFQNDLQEFLKVNLLENAEKGVKT
ncbi:MAG: hypothetical protein ACFFB8_12615 [Promethearchaeota archaeon]